MVVKATERIPRVGPVNGEVVSKNDEAQPKLKTSRSKGIKVGRALLSTALLAGITVGAPLPAVTSNKHPFYEVRNPVGPKGFHSIQGWRYPLAFDPGEYRQPDWPWKDQSPDMSNYPLASDKRVTLALQKLSSDPGRAVICPVADTDSKVDDKTQDSYRVVRSARDPSSQICLLAAQATLKPIVAQTASEASSKRNLVAVFPLSNTPAYAAQHEKDKNFLSLSDLVENTRKADAASRTDSDPTNDTDTCGSLIKREQTFGQYVLSTVRDDSGNLIIPYGQAPQVAISVVGNDGKQRFNICGPVK